MASYQPLEPDIVSQIAPNAALSFSTTQQATFLSSTTLLWTLGIVACVAATGFVFVRGGIFRMQASEAGIRKSNEEFTRGALGLLGVLGLFLLVFTVNKSLLLGDIGLSGLKSGTDGATAFNPTTSAGGGTAAGAAQGNGGAPATGDVSGRIAAAAARYRGTSTANAPGTNNGRSACAYAVNQVLQLAGIRQLGTSPTVVVSVEADLRAGRGQQVSQMSAVPGDIVIVTSSAGNHTGICLNKFSK